MRGKDVFALLYQANHHLRRARRAAREALGTANAVELVPYRGYGTETRAWLRYAVHERQRDFGTDTPRPTDAVARSLARYSVSPIPDVQTVVRVGDTRWEFTTDSDGLVETTLDIPRDASQMPWAVALAGSEEWVDLPMRFTDASAEYGVISDIDDTMIDTHISNLVRRAQAMFLAELRERQPFEACAEFYRELAAGKSGRARNPLFYVSSSPWNLYDHLVPLLDRAGFPFAPILLRQWGLRPDGFAPDGTHTHKRQRFDHILAMHPALRFVLFGDSGQADATLYASLVEAHPGRIASVCIRRVQASAKRIARARQSVERIRALGVPAGIYDSTAEMRGAVRV